MGPLTGLRIWELARTPAPAFAGHLLAEMGAEVVLAEPPGGSPLRRLPPFAGERSAFFDYVAAGVRARSMFDSVQDLADVHVVLHDERVLPAEWSAVLQSAALPERGRAVVACTPYGQEGPKSDWQATELTLFQAGGEGYLMPSGLAYEQFPTRSPIGVGRYLANYQGGLAAAVAALAALRASRARGDIEWVDVSVQEAQLSLNYFTVSRYVEGALESRQNRAFKYGGVLQCSDGYVELVTLEQRQWEALKEMMGDPQWAQDPAYADPLARGHRGDEINHHLRAWAAERTSAEVVRSAAEHGVPCGPYLAPEELPALAQMQAREFFLPADEREGTRGLFPGPPWRLNRFDKPAHVAAPGPRADRERTCLP